MVWWQSINREGMFTNSTQKIRHIRGRSTRKYLLDRSRAKFQEERSEKKQNEILLHHRGRRRSIAVGPRDGLRRVRARPGLQGLSPDATPGRVQDEGDDPQGERIVCAGMTLKRVLRAPAPQKGHFLWPWTYFMPTHPLPFPFSRIAALPHFPRRERRPFQGGRLRVHQRHRA